MKFKTEFKSKFDKFESKCLTYANVVSSNQLSKKQTVFFTDNMSKLNIVPAKAYAENGQTLIEKKSS